MIRRTGRPPLHIGAGGLPGPLTSDPAGRGRALGFDELLAFLGIAGTGLLRAAAGTLQVLTNLLFDPVTTKLTILRGPGSTSDSLSIVPDGAVAGQGTVTARANVNDQQIGLGMEDQVATDDLPAYLWKFKDVGLGYASMALEVLTGETAGDPLAITNGMGLEIGPIANGTGDAPLPNASQTYQYGGLGTGAQPGMAHRIMRNDSGAGAASCLCLQDRDGNDYFFWIEAGVMRFGTARPTEDDSVNHTSGAPV